jgi:hypothetical protein
MALFHMSPITHSVRELAIAYLAIDGKTRRFWQKRFASGKQAYQSIHECFSRVVAALFDNAPIA